MSDGANGAGAEEVTREYTDALRMIRIRITRDAEAARLGRQAFELVAKAGADDDDGDVLEGPFEHGNIAGRITIDRRERTAEATVFHDELVISGDTRAFEGDTGIRHALDSMDLQPRRGAAEVPPPLPEEEEEVSPRESAVGRGMPRPCRVTASGRRMRRLHVDSVRGSGG